jgi:hypothetical protein
MPTLEERTKESFHQLQIRLAEREEEFDVSPRMSEYIELMETYLLQLERRVLKMESTIGVEQ